MITRQMDTQNVDSGASEFEFEWLIRLLRRRNLTNMAPTPTDHGVDANTNGGRELRRRQGKELRAEVRDADVSRTLGMFFFHYFVYFNGYIYCFVFCF